MPEWKGRVPLTRSHCERITTKIGADLTKASSATSTSEKSSAKREAAQAANEFRGGEPLPNEPNRQSSRNSTYWQMLVCEKNRPKTAFVTPSGIMELRELPYRLKTSQANFQRMMDTALVRIDVTRTSELSNNCQLTKTMTTPQGAGGGNASFGTFVLAQILPVDEGKKFGLSTCLHLATGSCSSHKGRCLL
ncbi:hypothetical protein EVAR_5046_1 [Eumeta japonica]|uniref:Uncharacterized protein n=1 Tax=Eumeta variegata TaxID=151549 RepID=A0A4C1SUU2_EUMVA|nr:hypothetical protein EVAR_5046_1 [Eumeta japonica]